MTALWKKVGERERDKGNCKRWKNECEKVAQR